MPSELALEAVCRAVAAPSVEFCSLLAATVEEIRAGIPTRTSTEGALAGAGARLGAFATGRIDAERFARLQRPPSDVDDVTAGVLARALDVLSELEARGLDLQRVRVPPGGSLHDAVAAALTVFGRAFAAVRSVERARAGHPTEQELDGALDGFPFTRWSAIERRLAPPFVVEVAGCDTDAEGLASFLDGAMRFVLVVRDESPPAPLARLVTPGTFVVQTDGIEGLAPLLEWSGPGVAALVPTDCALFVHDPAAGASLAERLTVEHLPQPPERAIGGLSASQQAEQLAQLAMLSETAVSAPRVPVAEPGTVPGAVAGAEDPAGRLAAWLLHGADLGDLDRTELG